MTSLVLQCGFVAHSYQGVRQRLGRDEELDWPPSPGRIHQALISAALRGLPMAGRVPEAGVALDGLRWLEGQPPPDIVASAICEDADSSTHFRLAIPQNNPAKGDLAKTSVLLKPTPPHRAAGRSREPLRVDYVWRLEESAARETARRYFSELADLVAQVRYLGRGEDQVEARLEFRDDDCADGAQEACETWRPSDGSADADLWVARPRSTDELIRNYAEPVPERTRKPPASRFLREQGYAREATAGLLPVHVAIFQLFADSGDLDELPFSCDAENAGVWRAAIRQRAVDSARDRGRWDDPDLAVELVTGHPPGDPSRSEQPHLAFVPLPSIGAHGKADGRVRRFALLGYARLGLEADAAEVYRVLSASLDGEMVEAGASHYRLQLLERPQNDKVWPQFVRSARIWHSVTPVALARGFKVPTLTPDGSRRLSGNERHLRRLAEWTALLRASLRHIRLPEELAATCAITLTASPLVAHTMRAECYRPPGEAAVFTHARIEFTEPVRGPLLVGDRRYFGYGLFFPD
ncbi:MAG TPA: type I-U CRISPR-associated protein Csb2 [Bryobacteraceae bacterium]|nr:type I-U CRISPR-associated protein Csb2 [Bryobacteraceae bacterium]